MPKQTLTEQIVQSIQTPNKRFEESYYPDEYAKMLLISDGEKFVPAVASGYLAPLDDDDDYPMPLSNKNFERLIEWWASSKPHLSEEELVGSIADAYLLANGIPVPPEELRKTLLSKSMWEA